MSKQLDQYSNAVKKNYRWNVSWNVLDGVFFAIGAELIGIFTVIPGFIKLLVERVPQLVGWENRLATLAVVIMYLGWFLPPVFVAPYLESIKTRHPFILRVGLLLRVPIAILAVAIYFYAQDWPVLVLVILYLCLALFSSMDGLAIPVWMDFVSRMIPVNRRGIVLGGRMGLASLAAAVVLFYARHLLTGYPFPQNYAYLFGIAASLLAVSYICFYQLREVSYAETRSRLAYRAYWRKLANVLRRDRNFRRFLLISLFSGLTTIATISLYTMKVLAHQETSIASEVGVLTLYLTLVLLIGRGVFQPLTGLAGDRYGNKAVTLFSIVMAVIANLTMWAGDELTVFYFAFLLMGISLAAGMTSWLNWITEFSSIEDRLTYIIIRNLAMVLLAPLPFLGGYLADTQGHGFVFLLAAAIGLASFLLMLFMVQEPRRKVNDVFFGTKT